MRLLHGLLLAFVAAPLVATRTNAGEVLDQSFLATDSVIATSGPVNSTSAAQTFTVGVPGVLSRVAVDVAHASGNGDLSVRILTTTKGVPDTSANSVLNLTTVPSSSVGDRHAMLSVPLAGPPIQVTTGEVLAIALSVDTGAQTIYNWYGGTALNTLYAGGSSFSSFPGIPWQPTADIGGLSATGLSWVDAFETYVTVPEPLGVAGVSLVVLVLRRRR